MFFYFGFRAVTMLNCNGFFTSTYLKLYLHLHYNLKTNIMKTVFHEMPRIGLVLTGLLIAALIVGLLVHS